MKCQSCQFENREKAKFCSECGHKLELSCPKCGNPIRVSGKFCDECGCILEPLLEVFDDVSKIESPPAQPTGEIKADDVAPMVGERKHVTVLFSDLTGYTRMSERLDPEEVKEITSKIFGEISKIVVKYDGFIEKYAGDALMALFGVPKAHEDDSIRAVRAAREIHELVDGLSPELENRIGHPISMHTGINTGLVVTGEVDMERGTHGVAGDTINLASRLSNLAKPGEILIDVDTCRQAEGHFECEYLEETVVKGKADPVQVHKVLSQRDKPVTIRRLSGLRADLVGRKVELAELSEAVDNLHQGRGRIFSICGAAGTGKSRLVEEFKATLDFEQIQWIEGHAYAYSQNIPYFPLIDLLSQVLNIEESDPSEKVRGKVKSGLEDLIGENEEIIPYVGSLYSLNYSEVEEVSPEFWKSRLQSAVKAILSALANKAPTIFFLEDLHWADPSFVELLRQACLEIREPAIVLCVYRPTFNLFTGHQLSGVGKYYHEIQLQDLSRSESQDMLESLLKTSNVPSDLRRLTQSKAEGNPFYLEELVNSLIESETLVRDNGHWKITKPISETDISSSIHGLIAGRLDRLEKETKRILQEASVIGRSFLYEILLKITELTEFIDGGLNTLERLDLIRTRALQPDLEYMFKHPLTQEVVYNGVLKKERQEIHEQIALVMENIFQDRLPEIYETLAYHFQQGHSELKAVNYLIKSGEKCLKRFSLEESHKYFQEALNILTNKREKSLEEKKLIIDLIIKWALVYYYRGDAKGWTDLFISHKNLADSIGDPESLGMFYAWLGFSLLGRDHKKSYYFGKKALDIGEQSKNQKVIGYACTWLNWLYADLGKLEEAISFGKRAQEIAGVFESDQYLFFKSLGALGYTYWLKGKKKKVIEIAKILQEYGQKHSNVRCLAMGYFILGGVSDLNGAFSEDVKCYQKASSITADPFYYHIGQTWLAMAYLNNDQIQEAEEPLKAVIKFSRPYDCGWIETPAQAMLGAVNIAKGDMGNGFRMIEDALKKFAENDKLPYVVLAEHIMGKVFSQIVEKAEPISPLTMAKNIGFLIKNVPFAYKKAEFHLDKAIQVAEKIGAKGILGRVYLDLGLLHKTKKRNDKARKCISKAIQIFEECEAEVFLLQAKDALVSL